VDIEEFCEETNGITESPGLLRRIRDSQTIQCPVRLIQNKLVAQGEPKITSLQSRCERILRTKDP
jgi:hypothetical protein